MKEDRFTLVLILLMVVIWAADTVLDLGLFDLPGSRTPHERIVGRP